MIPAERPSPSPSDSGASASGPATWLAMGLTFAYLAVMAGTMWLFENALSVEDLAELIGDPHRFNLWLLIVLSAIVIFVFTHWTLRRITEQAPPDAEPDSPLRHHEPRDRRDSWALLAVLAVLLLATGGYVLNEQEKTIEAAQYRQIATVGLTKAGIASRWVGERRRDVMTLLENRDFVANTMALLKGGTVRDTDLGMPALDAMVQVNGLVGAVIVDRGGRVLYSEPDELPARSACLARARANSLDRAQPVELARAFEPSAGPPRLDAVGQVLSQDGDLVNHVATVCVRIDLGERLLPALAAWPMTTETGAVLLGRLQGNDVLVLNTPNHGSDRWSLERLAGAAERWRAALEATRSGQLHERDAGDGRRWLRAAFDVADTPWMLMARIDADEADRLQAHGQRRAALAAGLAFILAVAVATVGWARASAQAAAFVAERGEMISKLQDLAYHDSLTGLPRRPLTEDRLQVAVAQARRDGGSVGVLFIDLDGFKAINDRHGHAAGDAILQFVADKLSARLREGDTVGRMGGDEFLVVLPGCGDAEALARLGHAFVSAAEASLDWEGHRLSVGASVGGALFPIHGDEAAALTKAADRAMYRVKAEGGGYASA